MRFHGEYFDEIANEQITCVGCLVHNFIAIATYRNRAHTSTAFYHIKVRRSRLRSVFTECTLLTLVESSPEGETKPEKESRGTHGAEARGLRAIGRYFYSGKVRPFVSGRQTSSAITTFLAGSSTRNEIPSERIFRNSRERSTIRRNKADI